jgi:uncharacterized protein (DUF1697 family)
MSRQIVLLRGINMPKRNRIAMPALRDVLAGAGFGDVRTYVQSGNLVLTTRKSPSSVAGECSRLIADRFGLDIKVVVRTSDELAEVVRRNPFANIVDNPKRYQVCFLSAELDPKVVAKLSAAAHEPERFEVIGREVYAWHPEGINRSPLWLMLAGPKLGVTATSRNWTTVTTLLAMATEP